MTTFDLIRFPVNDNFNVEDLKRIPIDVLQKWVDTICIGSTPLSTIPMIADPWLLNKILFSDNVSDQSRKDVLVTLKGIIRDMP